MKSSENSLMWQSFVLLLVFCIVSCAVLLYPIYSDLNIKLILIISSFVSISILYFTIPLFIPNFPLVKNFWIKLCIFFLNIPILMWTRGQYNYIRMMVDSYTYDIPATSNFLLKSGISVEKILYLKNIILIASVSSLIMILFMQFYIVFTIFKYQQIPFIKKQSSL